MSTQWKNSKLIAWTRQSGLCSICSRAVPLHSCVGHHIKNKSQRGTDSADNCEIRCVKDERRMHLLYPYGNFKEVEMGNTRNRGHRRGGNYERPEYLRTMQSVRTPDEPTTLLERTGRTVRINLPDLQITVDYVGDEFQIGIRRQGGNR